MKDENTRSGRQFVVHQFPNQSSPYLEDLGFKTQFFEFEGFISNDDNLYLARDLLEAALRVKGAGELIHPTRGSFKAVCVEQSIGEVINEKGIVQVRLVFAAATVKPEFPITPLGLVDTQGDLLEDAFSGLSDVGSDLGPLGSTMVSATITGATTAVTSIGIGGIDSLFTHSTTGRYGQSYTGITTATGTSDREKFRNVKQQAIQQTSSDNAILTKSLQNLGSN